MIFTRRTTRGSARAAAAAALLAGGAMLIISVGSADVSTAEVVTSPRRPPARTTPSASPGGAAARTPEGSPVATSETTLPPVTTTTSLAAASTADSSTTTTRSASPTTVVPTAGVPPAAISFVPDGPTASVVPLGVLPTGELQLPEDPAIVGWWAGGAAVGATGTIVIAGHVDSRRHGLGAFAQLLQLAAGDGVEVADSLGRTHRFVVIERRFTPKGALPPELFTTQGPPQLVLITCGGEFDERSRHYADNVIVTAVPA